MVWVLEVGLGSWSRRCPERTLSRRAHRCTCGVAGEEGFDGGGVVASLARVTKFHAANEVDELVNVVGVFVHLGLEGGRVAVHLGSDGGDCFGDCTFDLLF